MQYAFYSWNLINFELVMLNYNEWLTISWCY
jgi:hypothetical protein